MSRTPEEIAEAALKLQQEQEAALASFKRWPESGVQTYRVQFTNDAGGNNYVDVEASTGNEAAELGLAKGGGKITNIAPAPKKRQKAEAA